MDIEKCPRFSSIQSAPHCTISKMARLGYSLNVMLSFDGSLRTEILFDAALLSTGFVLQECILGNWLNSEISINVQFRSGLPIVSRDHISRFVSRAWSPFTFCNLFRSATYDFTANKLLLLHKAIAFQRDIGSWPWSCQLFQQYSISFVQKSLCELHQIMGDAWFARIVILVLVFWIILFSYMAS